MNTSEYGSTLLLLDEELFGYYSGKGYFDTTTQFYIYKNPTKKEWKSVPSFGRGWISPKGDLYIEGTDPSLQKTSIIHVDILNALRSEGISINSKYVDHYYNVDYPQYRYDILKYGLLVQRVANTDALMFSESMHVAEARELKFLAMKKKANILYSEVHQKCNYLSFIYWNTGNENDEEEYNPWIVQ